MYKNVGGKLKALAKAYAIVVAIISIIAGMVTLASNAAVCIGLVLIIVVPFVAWLSSFILYGFGELIEEVSLIRRQKIDSTSNLNAYNKSNTEQIAIQESERIFNKNNAITHEISKCELCGKESQKVQRHRITGTGGWADLCDECAQKY